ncbi:MAG TPA: hypothetical protein VIM63_21260 [Rhodoferax sp.]
MCIATCNGMDVIDDCLRSVLGQQGDIPVKILVHELVLRFRFLHIFPTPRDT